MNIQKGLENKEINSNIEKSIPIHSILKTVKEISGLENIQFLIIVINETNL